MAYYNVCPICGANLDPGERCTCQEERREREKRRAKQIQEEKDGQLVLAALLERAG